MISRRGILKALAGLPLVGVIAGKAAANLGDPLKTRETIRIRCAPVSVMLTGDGRQWLEDVKSKAELRGVKLNSISGQFWGDRVGWAAVKLDAEGISWSDKAAYVLGEKGAAVFRFDRYAEIGGASILFAVGEGEQYRSIWQSDALVAYGKLLRSRPVVRGADGSYYLIDPAV